MAKTNIPAPSEIAALFLTAFAFAKKFGLSMPGPSQILQATGAPASTAYRYKAKLMTLLGRLAQPPGRPRSVEPGPEVQARRSELGTRLLEFVYSHPGAVIRQGNKTSYSDSFRRKVLELWEDYKDLGAEVFAHTACIPVTTLREWLRAGRQSLEAARAGLSDGTVDTAPQDLEAAGRDDSQDCKAGGESASQPGPDTRDRSGPVGAPAAARSLADSDTAQMPGSSITGLYVEAVVAAWKQWTNKKHGFSAFCRHVRHDLRIPLGRDTIRRILEATGLRPPARRRRMPDASAPRKAFATFFSGAQWQGDGKQVTVVINGQHCTVNVELMVDSHTGAIVGLDIRPSEDSQAVVAAFDHGVHTTGKPPVAVLLDNKPSNHTDQVTEGLRDSMVLRARPATPTDKAHVEGAFGLFANKVPDLVLEAHTLQELAGQVVRLAVVTWARTLNNRPRKDRGGKSRVELYNESVPTQEEIDQAVAFFQRRLQAQQRADETAKRRADPALRRILDDTFDNLQIQDPDGYHRDRIASWPAWAVIEALAVFWAKYANGRLPADTDHWAEYLLGIVRNKAFYREAMLAAEFNIALRLAYRDAALAPLRHEHDLLLSQGLPDDKLVAALVEHILDADRLVDRDFWTVSAARVIRRAPQHLQPKLLSLAARLINAHFSLPYLRRLALFDDLVQLAMPVPS